MKYDGLISLKVSCVFFLGKLPDGYHYFCSLPKLNHGNIISAKKREQEKSSHSRNSKIMRACNVIFINLCKNIFHHSYDRPE
jgi:hypothetical protein